MASASEQALLEAVAGALESCTREIDHQSAIVAEGESRLGAARMALQSSVAGSSAEGDVYLALLHDVVRELGDPVIESRRVASTFNIVFFGRTGAGKSTLLSALGRLNGTLVSDGRQDFTTEVKPLDWQGCRLYDTPGVNGLGAQRGLEESARKAVEIADIVLLCFDNASQQASEFRKVSEWVRAYRKPVIAVLNVKNPMWRHPALGTKPEHRNGLALAVQQHADNITGELESIGLVGVPVVAINAQRAMFARASAPFEGPAAVGFETERSNYGSEYLDRWSNLPVLEQLVSACIVEGAGDLRLSALREGFRARLSKLADQLDLVSEHQQQRGVAIERTVASWLNVLGYPDSAQDLNGLVDQLETARQEPFAAPVTGRLEGHARHLLKSNVYPHLRRSLRAADEFISDSFDKKGRRSAAELERRVFDINGLSASTSSVAQAANEFLALNLSLAARDAQIDLDVLDRALRDIEGNAGWKRRGVATALRALGMLGSGTGAVLAIVAATNWWNPGGWASALALAALSLGSWFLTYVGRRTRKGAEEQRVSTRSEALADARAGIHAYYQELETRQLSGIMAAAWDCASPQLNNLLVEALHTREGCAALAAQAAWLRGHTGSLHPCPQPTDIIQRATERVLGRVSTWDPPSLDAVLLGEDWVLADTHRDAPEELCDRDRERLAASAERDRAEFWSHLSQTVGVARVAPVRQWLEQAEQSEAVDQTAREELNACLELLDAQPNIVVLGDYSSGKTSLIKRMLAEAGAATPVSLQVEAGPATSSVQSYEFGKMFLVDSPGLQSGLDPHDELALQVSRDGALVIVVLHITLLIGDTTLLRQLLSGDGSRVGKAARTIFVIGRIDEVGDPRAAPREFLYRRQSKIDELCSLLESQGFAISSGQVLAVSADPYGLVGDRAPVGSADYCSANRVWDGVSSLCQPLLALDGERLADLSAGASLDRARTSLLTAQQRLTLERDELQETQAFTLQIEQLLQTSRAELRLLKGSIEQRIRRAVDDHAAELVDEALGADPAEAEALWGRLERWWEDPRLASAMNSLEGEVTNDVADWMKRHSSQLDRELRRFAFAMNRAGSPAASDSRVGDLVAEGISVGAGLAKGVHGVAKALGNRDAVYAIGKAMNVKFKPWGAVKLGAKVGKAAAVLGVVAVGFDIVDLVKDQRQEKSREAARKVAAEHVRATVTTVVSDLLGQADGPIEHLTQLDREVTDSLEQLREQRELQQQSAIENADRLDGVVRLKRAGDKLATPHTEKAMA